MILYKNLIFEKLKEQMSLCPDKDVLFDHCGRKIKAKDILKAIDIISVELSGIGVNKGDRVIFLSKPSVESILYFFALHRVGSTVVLVDPEMGQVNFNSRIKFSNAQWIIQDGILEKIERYSFIKPFLRFFNIWFPDNLPIQNTHRITIKPLTLILKEQTSKDIKEEVARNEEDMVIIFTSGTVDKPKGVVHSYKSLSSALKIITEEIAITKDDFLYASQFYFLLIGLVVGAQTYIPAHKKFDPKYFFKKTIKYNITSAFLLPHEGELIYKYCSNKRVTIPDSFRTILFGSAPVTKGFLSRFKNVCNEALKVYGVYGATEVLPISLVEMMEKINYTGGGDLLGKPVQGVSVVISEDKEIIISGSQLFTKYLGDNENSKCFYSGDLGTVDRAGNIVLLGRKKDMIIRKGFNVYPTLFESSIGKIPKVTECSMVGVYDNEAEDEKVVLFVISDTQEPISKDELKTLLISGKYSIDSYALPDEIIFIESLPRSGRSMKINKKELQILARERLCIL